MTTPQTLTYEKAIASCAKLVEIIKYFKDNNLINCPGTYSYDIHNTDYEVISIIGFDGSCEKEECNTYHYEYNYFVYVPEFSTVEVIIDDDSEQYEQYNYIGCSTEEGYFQGSTLYDNRILYALCLMDYLREHLGYKVYFDLEEIETMLNTIVEHKYMEQDKEQHKEQYEKYIQIINVINDSTDSTEQ